jgi:YhgE/Pip N-terminal domain/YhgE/Pip C-terminal domain
MKAKSNIKIAILIFGVILIPLLYSYFYLGAFWDPYSRLDTLPVAIVNNDTGATINGKERNLGNEMCDRLRENGNLKFIFTDTKDATKGTKKEKYYAMLVIPKDFSEDIASANTTEKHTASLSFSSNEKRNYLATQILGRAVLEIEESTRSSINAEITKTLSDKLKEVPDQMVELQDGMSKLSVGAAKLNDGAKTVSDGTLAFSTQFNTYKIGVSNLKNGSAQVNSGANSLNQGIDKLLTGVNTLTAKTSDIDKLASGAQSLSVGAKSFNESLKQYISGVDGLISNVTSTSSFLINYSTKINPDIMKDPYFSAFMTQLSDPKNAQNIQALQGANLQLKSASAQISAGIDGIAGGSGNLLQLKAALSQLAQGISQAKQGSEKLAQGAQSLYGGSGKIDSATSQLADAAQKIGTGAVAVSDGTSELKEGIQSAKDGVDTAVLDANEQIKSLDGLDRFAKEPVTIKAKRINPVPNYGTAFAPYFLSLSLWVGALIIFFGLYLDADGRFKVLSRNSKRKVARSFLYLLIGFAQALLLAIAIKVCLGLVVKNIGLYFLSCCLISAVFIAIVQFFLVYVKDFGKFIAIALLILNLTSCGGTFPMETVPKVFNVLYPYMPMTYSVGLLKQAISGAESGATWFNAGILFAILVVFMTATILLAVVKSKKEIKEI